MADVISTSALVSYDDDFFLWTQRQAALLRERMPADVDWQNLSKEIESSGKRDRREAASSLRVVMLHLLKWQFQPDLRSPSWRSSIVEHRHRLADILADSPSLRGKVEEALAKVYARARKAAAQEIVLANLSDLPKACPYSVAELLDEDWLPS